MSLRPPADNLSDERWENLLQAFGDLHREFQAFKDHDFVAFRAELSEQQNTYWHATAEALRVISDWWARETDKDRRDRAERQAQLDAEFAATHQFEQSSQQDRQHMRTMLTVLAVVEIVLSIIVLSLVVAHL